jgi:hypothetical protein
MCFTRGRKKRRNKEYLLGVSGDTRTKWPYCFLLVDLERLAFLASLADRVNKPGSQDAYVYAVADVAGVKLRLRNFEGAQKDLEKCQKILDSFDSVETVVRAAFYKVNADYYHVSPPFPIARIVLF